ncbi:MAG: bifunctional glutamate N-acetyltransferase/amino-acid acetyltransferase ArgJ [Opitutales bacterium]|nr:bifunctional glutamate N-acetyltransferase/amino-acid acetyltransferase ArgJ [Opitutales bacterium]
MKFYENGDGLTEPRGFFCSGIHCDIKGKRDGNLDLGIIYSSKPCHAAAVFTTNDIKAAPVLYSQSLILDPKATFHAIVANSGNANACTGNQGKLDTIKMGKETARHLKAQPHEVFVCSTGRIGVTLPMSKITAGIRDACEDVMEGFDGAKAFQQAILTSDTCTKSCSATITTRYGEICIGGVVKGAGMIEPNMATMLAFLTTDAGASNAYLQKVLQKAVDKSFNRITIDGDMSTNDSVIMLANGNTGIEVSSEDESLDQAFQKAVEVVCQCLAKKCVTDGEKVTKFVSIQIQGAKSNKDAEKVGRCIANSLLVKSSWYGSDPNWGRIVDAAGYAKVGLEFEKIDMFYNEVPALQKGEPIERNKSQWKAIASQRAFTIKLDLNQGSGESEIWGNDLSEEYVNFNKSE